jgi:hypothetical protein
MSPAIGKAMEATLVVLYVGLIVSTLYAGAVPEYRTSAGQEVAERTLADAATDIETAVPPETVHANVRVDIDLPPTIAGDAYRIHAGEDELRLDHPNPAVRKRIPLVLPDRVGSVSGTWSSGEEATVRIVTVESGLEVTLE